MSQMGGKPWSGNNKIPTISQFVDRLDKGKSERDKNLDSSRQQHVDVKHQGAMPHKNQERLKDAKEVSDPVTGNQVMIADVGEEARQNAANPMVSLAVVAQAEKGV